MAIRDDIVRIQAAGGLVVLSGGLPGAGLVCARGIRQYEGVFTILVFEEIKNSVLLHQTRYKVKIGLSVLHAILPGIVTAGQGTLEVAEAPVGEHLLDNVGNGHVLENAAARIASEKPEPGHDFQLIVGEAGVGTAQGEAADETIEVALGLIRQGDADGDILADNVFEGDRVFFGEQVEVEAK